jgi:predicted ATPase/class 3 adenylate cyclase
MTRPDTLQPARGGALTSYLPGYLLRQLAADGPRQPPHAEPLAGAVLLADVRGFTRLTEQMAERGPDGVETLTSAMNRYFGGMIDCIGDHGGEVVSFAGDAMLALWPAAATDDGLAAAVHAAARCAVVLGAQDADVAAGVEARLKVRLAIGVGDLSGVQVGGMGGRIYCFLMGRPLERVAEAISHAAAGEVAIDAAGWELLRGHAEGRPCPGGAHVVSSVRGGHRFRRAPATAVSELDEHVLEPFIVPSVLAHERVAHGRWLAELRRLTVVFLELPDLVHGVGLDDIQRLIAALQTDFWRHGASMNQIGVDNHGTTLLAATGLPPHSHDDDPERGVRTAVAVAQTLERLGLHGAIGVTTGRALCSLLGNPVRREYTIIGDIVNMAARLCTAGAGGEQVSVLCDAPTVEATRRRIEYGEPLELTVKGKTRPITAYRPAGRRIATAAPGTMAFGRSREQRAIRAAIESVAAGKGRAVAIQAEPGMGKSRLLSGAVSLAGARGIRCVGGAGDVIEHAGPYHAWRRVFAELLEVDDRSPAAEREQQVLRSLGPARRDLAPLLNVVLGLDLPETQRTEPLQNERRVQATRQFLLALLADAAADPLMVGIDDAHWLDSASWTLLRELARRGLPVLTVVATRPIGTLAPEYAQLLADPDTVLIELAPLATEDAVELACDRLGVVTLADAVADVIVDRAGGNPLFVEEIAHALRDARLIDVVDGVCLVAAGADLRELAMPDTVEGVIANRMDGLEPRVDLTLKVASVVGRTFSAELLHDVYPVSIGAPQLDGCLDTLVRRDLTLLQQTPPATSYAFRHVLIRDVAYGRMLFGQRRELHRAIAEWHEQRSADNLAPVYSTLAHHFTQAGLVDKACDYLGLASVQAINHGMGREAVDLGLAAARMLGVDLPRAPSDIRAAIGQRLEAIGERMADRSIESLADLPPATDPVKAAAIGALLRTAPAAFISQQTDLFALIGLEGFLLTLDSGSTPYAPGVIALYALLMRSLDADPRPAYALSSLAERLAERDSPALRAYAGFVRSWFVHHWVEPIADDLPKLEERAAAGFEHGDVMFGCFNAAGYVTQLAASGAPLEDVIAAGTAAGERVAGRVAAAAFHCQHEVQFAKALAGRTIEPCSLTDAPREGTVDEERDLASVLRTDLHNQQGYYLTSKLRLHFYYRDYARAVAFGDQAERLLPAFAAQQQEVEFVFFQGLALLAQAREAADDEALARGLALIERMRSWERFAPGIFGHRVLAMEAQHAWARGEPAEAAALFARAGDAAVAGSVHHAALARELAGRCLLESGEVDAARDMLREAIRDYRTWGALAKADDVAAALAALG